MSAVAGASGRYINASDTLWMPLEFHSYLNLIFIMCHQLFLFESTALYSTLVEVR